MPPDEALKGKAVTSLTRYAEVREAFKCTDFLQTSYDGAKETVFADVLVTLDGDPHKRRRRSEVTLVRPQIIADLENRIIPSEAARLIAEMKTGGEADLTEISRVITTGLAARIVGLDDCTSIARLRELTTLMARLHEGAVIDWSTRTREEVLAGVRVVREEYRERFFNPSLTRREARVAAGEVKDPPDLIHLLLVHRERLAMDTDMMLRETVHYLVATGHTTSTVFVHGCDEIWRWIDAHPEDAARLADPMFMQACMNEATRLWPPSGWQTRRAATDVTLRSGRRVHRGEALLLNLIEANRDPDVFGANADRFDPHRPETGRATAAGLAYGDGEHVCLGKRMAMGVPDTAGSGGVLAAMGLALFASGARPHPSRAPVVQEGTARHQFRSYPIAFA